MTFSGTGGTGNENEAAAHLAEFFTTVGTPSSSSVAIFVGMQSKDCAVTADLLEIIDAKPSLFVHLIGEVEVAGFFEPLPAAARADFAEHEGRLFVAKGLVANREHFAVTTDFRRLTLREMQIGAFRLEENVEELVDVGHGYFSPSACLMSVLFSAR